MGYFLSQHYKANYSLCLSKRCTGKPVENAEVDLRDSDNDVTADKIGYFQLVDMKPGHYSITISKPGFEHKIIEFDVMQMKEKRFRFYFFLLLFLDMTDLGVITIDDSDTKIQTMVVSTYSWFVKLW